MSDPVPFRPTLGALCAATVLLLATAAAGQPQRCTILDDCAGIDSLPTAAQCEEDDCSCAQQVECYLRDQSPTDKLAAAAGRRGAA